MADDPRARAAQRFRDAAHSYEQGQFAAAATAFEESALLVPRAAALYNAAVAWEAAGDPARAAQAYEGAVRRPDLPPDQATSARRQLLALSRKLGLLDVFATQDARLAVGSIEGSGPRLHLYVAPGPHDVRVTWPDGSTQVRTVEVAAGASEVARFEAPAPALPPRGVPTEPPRQPSAPEAKPTPFVVPPSSPHGHALRTAGWITLASSVAFTGAAIVLGVETLDARNTLVASNDTNAAAHDEALRYRLLTNVAWGASALSAALGGTLLVLSFGKRDAGTGAQLAVTSGPGSLAVRWRF